MLKNRVNESIFTVQNQYRTTAKTNIVTAEELNRTLSDYFDYMKQSVTVSTFRDQDGYNHIIFIKESVLNDKERLHSFKESLRTIYNNFFGTGCMCNNTSYLLCQHEELCCIVEGYESCEVDEITIASFIKSYSHCNNTFLIRMMCEWLYNVL